MTVTVSDPNYQGSASGTLVIAKAAPTVTWTAPAAITYGTALSVTQLNATGSVPGSFSYAPAAGMVLGAGTQTLTVTFTPTDAADYASATANVSLMVNKTTPTITWAAPGAITYGTALSATQLNATANLPGSLAYSPATGTVLSAGNQTLTATFTPADAADYASATANVSLTVNKTAPTITWATPAAISYGTALSGAQLNATTNVPGSFAYSPAAGVVLSAGTQTLTATFTPADAADYAAATANVTLTVNKAVPTITWATPAAISYGTALSATQLNATASVPGSLAYTPAAGTVLSAGTQTLTATFTPTDAADYTAATANVTLTVNKAVPTITWATPAAISYGTALSGAQLNATASVPGSFAYNPAAGMVLGAGTQTLTATFTPVDAADYTAATANVTLVVNAPASTFSISGTISGSGGVGATVALSGVSAATALTDGSGNYSFAGLASGSYAVVASNTGFVFSPPTQLVALTIANATGINFTASVAPPTYLISGTITPSSNGSGAGATVTLSGFANAATTADSSGNYTFSGLVNGSYVITPASAGAIFNPSSRSVAVSGANKTGVNFAASTLLFYDDFTSSTLSSLWAAENRHGDYSNDELQCYLPANIAQSSSMLTITTVVQTQVCGDADTAPAPWNYTSGMVQWTSLSLTYGTIEFRAKMPGGTGTWPAVWLLGLNCQAENITGADSLGICNWPLPGSDEIDITEILNSNQTAVNQEIHTVAGTNGTPLHNDGCAATTSDVSQNYHVYDLVWTAGSVVWKIDGKTTCTVNQSYVPSTPMFLIINTAVGGAGGTVNNSTLPQSMYVDYVQVSQP